MPSEVTLRKLIARHADFPIVRRGGHGRKYRIDLEAAEQFVRQLREGQAMEAELRRAAIKALGLEMLAEAERNATK